ncbi:hypothetical protein DJ568_05075 [Mucilaginibacter hurinus]|uniref:HEAT repeat domain-containing protein n=1 Tax=Mucilaginibacter hurinus TaxID=2201324 RepID=A0A367GS97_9SPHI|nr:hypothetical protein [Mucilaginibacter hurinus]RCH56120.1 hypothetical protein DJ568_05075 [Mucilaginibacter hurinus]
MLSQQLLAKLISSTIGKAKVLELTSTITEQQFPLCDLIDLTFHPDKKIAFRASWILENVLMQNANAYVTDLPYLLHRFPEVNHASSQRHYANILTRLTSSKGHPDIKAALANINMEPVVEKLFDWMIDPKVLVAVKCSAAEALMHLSQRYDWITEELRNQLEFLMRNGTAALQARGKMILKKIQTKS